MPHRIKYFSVAPEWAKVIIEYVHYPVINFYCYYFSKVSVTKIVLSVTIIRNIIHLPP